MANFLDSLGMGGSVDVYVAISATNGAEMVVMDQNNTINSYAQVPLEYNDSLREITDYSAFEKSLTLLFEKCNVNPQKANVHLSLPTVWFGFKDSLPLLLDDSAITSVVTGELEQTYVFKRKDPVPYWFDALVSTNSDSRSVFYTAIQKDVMETLKVSVKKIGANLVEIGLSLFSDLKGLYINGITNNLVDSETSWSLMIVSNSGFQMYNLQGRKILEYYEEPLAIKSYEGDEVYAEIENAAQIALMSTPSTALVVLSETHLVSAEVLAQNLQFTGQIIAVDDNKFKKEPFKSVGLNVFQDQQLLVSLQATGIAGSEEIIPYAPNFLALTGKKIAAKSDVIEIPIGNGRTIKLTPMKAIIVAGVILGLVGAPLGIAYVATDMANKNLQSQTNELNSQISSLDNELSKYDKKEDSTAFNVKEEIEKVLKANRQKIMSYAALGESIPRNLYLTYFISGDDGMINIKGSADSVEDVYLFFKNLKESLVDSNLRLNKLDLKNGSIDSVVNSTLSAIDNAPYIFEITNMNEEQLKAFMGLLTGTAPKSDANSNNQQQPAQDAAPAPAAQAPAPSQDSNVPQEVPAN